MTTHIEPILAFVRRRLDASRGEWTLIASNSGVPYHTLTKIAQGAVENPRIHTVQRLVDLFQAIDRGECSIVKRTWRSTVDAVIEPAKVG